MFDGITLAAQAVPHILTYFFVMWSVCLRLPIVCHICDSCL